MMDATLRAVTCVIVAAVLVDDAAEVRRVRDIGRIYVAISGDSMIDIFGARIDPCITFYFGYVRAHGIRAVHTPLVGSALNIERPRKTAVSRGCHGERDHPGEGSCQ